MSVPLWLRDEEEEEEDLYRFEPEQPTPSKQALSGGGSGSAVGAKQQEGSGAGTSNRSHFQPTPPTAHRPDHGRPQSPEWQGSVPASGSFRSGASGPTPTPPIAPSPGKADVSPRQKASKWIDEDPFADVSAGAGNSPISPLSPPPINRTPTPPKATPELVPVAGEKKKRGGEVIAVDFRESSSGAMHAPPPDVLRRLEKPLAKRVKPTISVETPSKEKKPKPTKESTASKKVRKGDGDGSGVFLTEPSVEASPGKVESIGVGVGIGETSPANNDLAEIPPLSETDQVELKAVIGFFDLETVSKLRSHRHQHRTSAVESMTESICSRLHAKPVQSVSMAFTLWRLTVSDKVLNVFQASVSSMKTVMASVTFIDEDNLPELNPTLLGLTQRLRDSNHRSKSLATEALLLFAGHSSVGPICVVEAVCGVQLASSPIFGGDENGSGAFAGSGSMASASFSASPASANWKAVQSKLDFIVELTKLDPNCYLSCKDILGQLVASGMASSNAKTRQTAVQVAVEMFKVVGVEVESFLGEVSAATLRTFRDAVAEVTNSAMGGSSPQRGGAVKVDKEEEEDIAGFDAEAPQLSAETIAQIQRWKQITGLASSCCFYSGRWKLRDRAIDRLNRVVCNTLALRHGSDAVDGPVLSIQGAEVKVTLGEMSVRALSDTVPNVLTTAAELCKSTVSLLRETAEDMLFANFAKTLLPCLVRQAGVTSNTELCTQLAVTEFASHKAVGPQSCFVAAEDCGDIPLPRVAVKLLLPRLKLAQELVDRYGFDNGSDLSLDAVMKFTLRAFEHPQAKARSAAVNIIVSAYKQAGSAVQVYLQQLKGPLLEELKSKISTIAKKERTNTAPMHRLAGILQPLESTANASPNGGTNRPATFGAGASEGVSIRERMARWQAQQQKEKAGGPLDPAEGTSSEDDATGDAPILRTDIANLGIAGGVHAGVIRPGAARKNRLVFS
jgi:hypothetical protein